MLKKRIIPKFLIRGGRLVKMRRFHDDQREARRMVAGRRVEVHTTDEDGQASSQEYVVPNTNQCENCHGPGSGHMSAPNNPQLLAAMMPWRTAPVAAYAAHRSTTGQPSQAAGSVLSLSQAAGSSVQGTSKPFCWAVLIAVNSLIWARTWSRVRRTVRTTRMGVSFLFH